MSRQKVNLQGYVMAVVRKYGSYREAAAATGVDHAYLQRLVTGEADAPSDEILGKLKLVAERKTTYYSDGGMP